MVKSKSSQQKRLLIFIPYNNNANIRPISLEKYTKINEIFLLILIVISYFINVELQTDNSFRFPQTKLLKTVTELIKFKAFIISL